MGNEIIKITAQAMSLVYVIFEGHSQATQKDIKFHVSQFCRLQDVDQKLEQQIVNNVTQIYALNHKVI